MASRTKNEYNTQRKVETEEKLKQGLLKMKSNKQYKNKPLSIYGLSKLTGVSKNTIKRFPSIMEAIEKSRFPAINLKSMHVKIGKVGKPEDLLSVVETLEKMYNEVVDKYNAVMNSNLRLNLELVKLQDEKAELKHQLDVLIKGR